MNEYTAAQQRAIDSTAREIVCIAGPGSGKTKTTVGRIRRLIVAGVEPRRIVALTFTNAGADELLKRIHEDKVWNAAGGITLGYCGTLHGFALRCLKEFGASIGYGQRMALIGEDAAADLMASKAQTLGCKTRLADLMKLKSQDNDSGPAGSVRGKIDIDLLTVRGYRDDLRDAGMVDFDTILTEFLRFLQRDNAHYSAEWSTFTHLFVDEAQDSAAIDWQIYDALPIANKFYVGDTDQAIYAFRGGRSDILAQRAKTAELHLLEANFRSHTEICEAAQRLIEHNTGRVAKQTISAKGPGGLVADLGEAMNEGEEIARVANAIKFVTDEMKAKGISDYVHDPSQIAVLARTNSICHAYRATLKACGVPVAEPAKSNLPPDWSLARALVELMVNPDNDTLAFFYLMAEKTNAGLPVGQARREAQKSFLDARQAGEPITRHNGALMVVRSCRSVAEAMAARGITKESQMLVATKLRRIGSLDMLALALAMNQPEGEAKEDTAGVTVTTFHGMKGREADVVFIVGAEDEICPGTRKDANIEEERRLMYVAATRARKALYIAHSASRVTSWGKIEGHVGSRFIAELLP